MNTKIVYVLTCAPEKHYIEQALMSIFSARHWNSDAHIVLIVDDLTDQLLVGQRAEILKYISEKIVVQFVDTTFSPLYRSRWIKTSVRKLVEGDYLFVDSDTIICKSLEEIDALDCEVGAVLESHLLVKDFCDDLRKRGVALNMKIGVNLDEEKEYFSSGVLLVKDTPETHCLYQLWHQYWLESVSLGLNIDQPSLAKANRECGHIISRIPDTYNCILFTRNSFTDKAHVLHVAAYRNPSFIFSDKVLRFVQENGLNNEWFRSVILKPCSSFLPFDYDVLHSNRKQRKIWRNIIAVSSKGYGKVIDSSFEDFPMQSRFRWIIVGLFRINFYGLSAWLWMLWKRLHVWSHKAKIKDNVCRK